MSKPNLESYPPLFRQYSTCPKSTDLFPDAAHDDANICKEARKLDEDPVPVIDLQCLNLEKLGEACKDWGVFRLVNHGIPLTLLSKLQDHSKKLFFLSFEYKKQVIGDTPLSYFFGTPLLTSSGASPLQNINWVEGFNVPLTQLSQFQPEDPMLDFFRLLLEEYGRHLSRIASTIFEAMAKILNLNHDQSKSYLSESTGLVRIYRYPQCSVANDTMGMEAHTDSSVISILNAEQVSGLEVFKDDKWLIVEPIPNTLILNLGDMMQAISDDKFKSVTHRVKVNRFEERLSICYFVFPAEGSVIQSSKYKPFTYKEFQEQVQQDTRNVGFKVGLERFKLTEAAEPAAS